MTNNTPQRWEDIKKTKLSDFNNQSDVTAAFNKASKDFKENKSKSIQLLKKIYGSCIDYFSKNQTPPKHDDLFPLVYSKDLLRLAFRKLSRNKGALTPGTENSTADGVSEREIEKISAAIKEGKFIWTRTRRIWIPKPGKTELRPLGLPDFSNKMVQEVIRMILESIYEPEFKYLDVNYGFRPNLGCGDAINRILTKSNGADFFIEGDIKGAYDNVNHERLMQILAKRIKDHKFLNLIRSGLKCGIMDAGQPVDTLLGIPQGGIASPILFNIYMNEVDNLIQHSMIPHIESNYNIGRIDRPTTQYYSATSRVKRTRSDIQRIENSTDPNLKLSIFTLEELIEFCNLNNNLKAITLSEWYKNRIAVCTKEFTEEEKAIFREYQRQRNRKNNVETKQIADYSTEEKSVIRNYNSIQVSRKRFKKDLIKEIIPLFLDWKLESIQFFNTQLSINKADQLSSDYIDPEKKRIKLVYTRYADDWVLSVRGSEEITKIVLTQIEGYLKQNLFLTLSREKTKITNPRTNKVLFLGFEIFYQRNKRIRKVSLRNNSAQRFTGLQAHPDSERLRNRFLLRNLIDTNGNPRELGFLTVLQDHEIIEKYNQFMMGIGVYYISYISYPSRLNKWHYILYYSCIKTLATKHKSSVKNIINHYGYIDSTFTKQTKNKKITATDKRIVSSYTVDEEVFYRVLLNYKEFTFKLNVIKNNPPPSRPTIDFLKLQKVNWRTAFKTTQFCGICSNTYKLQNHHIRPIRHKQGKYNTFNGFDKLVASLGRKQITVCEYCHQKIHKGEYNGLSLDHLYDLRLTTPETYIKLPVDSTFVSINNSEYMENKLKDEYVIDHQLKTIYHKNILKLLNLSKQ
jgi:retron-type reverse transcriptase